MAGLYCEIVKNNSVIENRTKSNIQNVQPMEIQEIEDVCAVISG